MPAGDFGDLYTGWVYGTAPPLGAAVAKYKYGMGDVIVTLPEPKISTIRRDSGNSALPNGFYTKKTEIYKEKLVVECYPVDATIFYHGHGEVTQSTVPGTNFPDWTIALSDDGSVPSITHHSESNHLKTDQPREYYDSRSMKQSVGFKENLLHVVTEYMIQREYDVDADTVVRSSVAKTLRADKSPLEGYSMSNPNSSTVWSLAAGNKDLSTLFESFNYIVEPSYLPIPEDDGNDYAATLQNQGRWNPGSVEGITFGMTFSMDKLDAVIDLLRGMRGIGNANAADKMIITLGRRHANDTIVFNFKQAILKGIVLPIEQSSTTKGIPMLKALFVQVQGIEIEERVTTSAGVSEYNNAATYGL